MGEAFNRSGDVLGTATGASKAEVLEKLEAAHPDAYEIRIREALEKLDSEYPDAHEIRIRGEQGSEDRPAAERTYEALAKSPTPGGSNRPPLSERLTLENVDEAFTYQPWDSEQAAAGSMVRLALLQAARIILQTVPECPLRTRALNHLIDARMVANAAITFRGRF